MHTERNTKTKWRLSAYLPPLAWGISTGLLGWATLQSVPWAEVGKALHEAELVWVFFALVSVLVNNGAKVWRWRALLGEEGERLGWGALATGHLVGQLINTFVPGRAGEIGRLYLVGPGWCLGCRCFCCPYLSGWKNHQCRRCWWQLE